MFTCKCELRSGAHTCESMHNMTLLHRRQFLCGILDLLVIITIIIQKPRLKSGAWPKIFETIPLSNA